MKVATCIYQHNEYVGIVVDEHILIPALEQDWPPLTRMLDVIDGGPLYWDRLANSANELSSASRIPLTSVKLMAPIPRPRKNIVCLGLNYIDHAKESFAAQGKKTKVPNVPIVFTKATTSVNNPYGDIPYNAAVSKQLDWEVELGVVIGVGGRHISKQAALEHVFGYTIINDISARDVQFRHKQYFLGKSLDGACPMGPWIVTVDEIPDPQKLDLKCWVNNNLKQNSNTCYQLFDIASVIETLSRHMTLEPGDIIATGTPAGVGFARTPPEFLQPDDKVKCYVQNIGMIENTVVEVGR